MQSIDRLNFGFFKSKQPPESPAPAPQTAEVTENYGWILHPAIDLIFICGGIAWIFALFATNIIPGLNQLSSKAFESLTFAFFLIFVVPHGMATFMRVYDVPATRKSSGLKVALLALLCGALVVVGCISEFWASLVSRLALSFSFQHGLAQAYGIALIYCYKQKFYLSKTEKKILSVVIQAGIWLGVVSVWGNPNLVFANVQLAPILPAFPSWVFNIFEFGAGAAVLTFCGVLVRKYIREKQLMPLPAVLTLVTGFLIYAVILRLGSFFNSSPEAVTPEIKQMVGWLVVMYYAAHGLFHTPQYLAITTAVHLKTHKWPASLPTSKISSQLLTGRALRYFLTLYSIAWLYMISSSQLGPVVNQMGWNHHPELWYLVFISCTNLHHYWADAIVWKLKDKENMRLLVS